MKKLVFLIFLTSCGARSPLVFEVKSLEKPGSFKALTTNILQTKCVNCHRNFKIEENLLKYIDGNNPETSQLFEVVKNGSMPKKGPPLTTLELEMVRSYIENVENVPSVTFQEFKTKILEPKCLSCHKRMGDEALVVERWVNQKSLFESKLYLTTSSGSMPKNNSKLNKEEMKIIKGYLKTK